jgi:hypothetical protein
MSKWLGGADRAVDQPVALEGSDGIAADLAARQLGNLPRVTGCK